MGFVKCSLVALALLALQHQTLAQVHASSGSLFGSESEVDLSAGDNSAPYQANGYLPPINSSPSDNIPAYSGPPKEPEDNSGRDDSPTNVQPNVVPFPPAGFQPQLGCAAALLCVEEQFCTSTGVISKTPIQLTEEQKLRRVPMVDCRNPDNGIIGKCCRDPDYVDPWPAGNLSPEQLKQGFDEQGFPKFLNLTKNKPQRPFRPRPVPKPTGQFSSVNRPQQPFGVPQQPIRPIAPIQPPQTGFQSNKIVPETKPFQTQPIVGQTQLPAFSQKPFETKNPFLQQPKPFQHQPTFQPQQPNPNELGAEFPQQAKQPEIIVVPEQPQVVPQQPHVTVQNQPQGFISQQPSGFVKQPQQPSFTVTVTEQPQVFHQPEQPSFAQPEQPKQSSFVQTEQPSYVHPTQPSFIQTEQPSYVHPKQPSFAQPEQPKQPLFVQTEQPSYVHSKQPSFVQPEQPSFVQPEQPLFVQTEQPSYVHPKQPSFVQPEQPSFVQPEQPSFVQPEQPSYVQPEQPSYVQPEQPSYVQPEQPSFVQTERPSYVQPGQPSFVQPGQPSYVQPEQPSYVQPEQPSYVQPEQPSFVQTERPSYVQPEQPAQPSIFQQPQQPQHGNLPSYNQVQGQPKGPFEAISNGFNNIQQSIADQINKLPGFGKPDSQTINAPAIQDEQTTTKKPFFSFPNIPNPFGQKIGKNQAPVLPSVSIAPHTPGAQCGIINQVQQNYAEGFNDVQTPFGEIPWQAMVLHNTEKKLLCSGAVIAPNVVMTAAHCVYGMNPREVSIKVGEWKLGYELKHEEPLPFEIAQVQNIETHPGYQPGGPGSDLAMLFLEKPVKLDQHVDTICLGQQPSVLERKCISVGWGKTVLQLHAAGALMNKIEVDTLSQDQCRTRLQGAESPLDLDNSLVCVKAHRQNNNLCQVDVGGPLACDRGDGHYELVGVYSQDTGCLPTNQVATFALLDNKWVNDMLSSPTNTVLQQPEASNNYEGPQPGQDRIHYHPQQPGVPCDCQQGTQPAGANAYLPPY